MTVETDDPLSEGDGGGRPPMTTATTAGVQMTMGPLPECVRSVWAERDGRRWLVVRDTMTMKEAREHVGALMMGDPGDRFATVAQDPRHAGVTIAIAGTDLPASVELAEAERGHRRVLILNESLTVARAQRLVAERLADLPRPRFHSTPATD